MRGGGAWRDRRGNAAVEFALLLPIFSALFIGVVDIGAVLHARLRLNGALSAATHYALVNPNQVSSTGGDDLAQALAGVVASTHATNYADATVTVNNGPSRTLTAGVMTSGGNAVSANQCYCPTGNGGAISWGSAVICGSTCPNSLQAGKFVAITASRTHDALFSDYGIISNGVITARTLVQTE